MNTVVWTVVAAVLAFVSVVAHEAGHVAAFRRAGVRVAEVGLGLPLPPRITLAPTARRPFALALSPWPVGAYVRAHDGDHDRMRGLPYRDRAWINSRCAWAWATRCRSRRWTATRSRSTSWTRCSAKRGGDVVWRIAKFGGGVLLVGDVVWLGWLVFA